MTTRPISQIIADLKATCAPGSDVALVCDAHQELHHDLQLANNNAQSFQRACHKLQDENRELQSKLAAHDACLTQVREANPEVERLRNGYSEKWTDIHFLIRLYDQQCQNEARWRNTRDVWQARETDLRATLAATEKANAAYYKQHKGMQRELASERDAWEAERKRLEIKVQEQQLLINAAKITHTNDQDQLSASNAACAEIRQGLEIAEGALNLCYDVAEWPADGSSLQAKALAVIRDLLAAQPKQQQGPTPEQYAIEHGRYLATAAGLFMESCNALVSAEQELDKAEPDTQEEVDDLMAKTDSAQEIRSERFRALEKAIYEFTKRADRAYVMQQENGNG